MAKRSYTDDFRAEVLAVYEVDGPSATARLYGVPLRTLVSWAQRHGLHTVADTKAMTQTANEANELRRTKLRGMLVEYAIKLMERIDEPHIDFKSAGQAGPVEVTFPRAPSGACRDYVWSASVLLDKYRLEQGEATGRGEVTVTDTTGGRSTLMDEIADYLAERSPSPPQGS